MKPQTEEQWLMVLAVIERLYAEVRAGNWDGLRQMLHGYTTSPPEPSAEPCSNYDVLAGFADWLCREMPADTIIGDPRWWAPRILRAVEVFQKSRGTAPEPGAKR